MTNPTHICPTLMKSLHKSMSVLAFACTLTIALQSSQAQTFTVIHNFTGREDGGQPEYVAINPAGILYGTTALDQYGTVFKLKQVNSSWVLSTLFAFNVYSGTAKCTSGKHRWHSLRGSQQRGASRLRYCLYFEAAARCLRRHLV